MNYFGIKYFLLNQAKKEEEINATYIDYRNNLLAKEGRFPLRLKSIIFNEELYDLSMIAYGSLNLEIKEQNDGLQIQIPHTVGLDSSYISEFLLLNLSLSTKTKNTIIQYNNGEQNSMTLETLQDLIKDKNNFYLNNICWDILKNNQIELNLNFLDNLNTQCIELSLNFCEEDILSAKLRVPNYSSQDYVYLEESGENDVTGYNRTKKILNIINKYFEDKKYTII